MGGSPDSRVFVELPQRLVVVQPGHGLGDRGLVLGIGLLDSGMAEEEAGLGAFSPGFRPDGGPSFGDLCLCIVVVLVVWGVFGR